MWIYTVAPDWIIHLLLLVGLGLLAVGFFLSFVPLTTMHRWSCKIGGSVLTAFGLYLEGGLQDNNQWLAKIQEMQIKVEQAEAQAQQKNVEIQEVVVTKTEVIKERGQEIVKYIDRIVDREILKEVPGPERERMVEVIKYVENCPIPQVLIDQHNRAARPPEEPKK